MTSVAELRLLLTGKDDVSKILKDVSGSADGLATAAKVGIGAVAGLGTVAAGGLAISINAAANFEHALDQVGAVANATDKEMRGLSDTALRIGKDTAFSATEAAQAMEMLAANGVSVADIMNGAADAAVSLAAAGGTDLKTAADVASTSMAVWGLKASEMNDVVNRLAGAANVSRFGVEDMAGAIAMGGGAARVSGMEFADFSAAIAAIAPNFSSGSDAGTSFKQFLAGLTPETKSAKKAFAELGLTAEDGSNRFFDAAGNLKSMADITGILNVATRDLSEEQKAVALNTIFGSDAMRAAAGVAGLTQEEFTKLYDTMGNTSAADVAAQRMGNFKGSMEAFKGSLETIEIQLGSKFLPLLTQMADFAATQLPIAFAFFETEIEPKLKTFATQAAGHIRAFVDFAKPYLAQFSAEAKVQFAKFQQYYQTDLKPAFDNIVRGVEYVVQKFQDNWASIEPVVKRVGDLVSNRIEMMGNALQIIVDILGGDWKGAWENTVELLKGIVTDWKNILMLGVEGFRLFVALFRDVGQDIMKGLRDGAVAIWDTWIWPFFKGLPRQALNALGDLSHLLVDVGKAIARSLLDGLVEGAQAVWSEVSGWGDKLKSLKGPIEADRQLLNEEGVAIAWSLGAGLNAGFNSIVVPEISSWAPIIEGTVKSLYDNVPDYVKNRGLGVAGGQPSEFAFDKYMPQDQGGGQSGYLGGGVGPNGTVWDPSANAYVKPWDVGLYDSNGNYGDMGKAGTTINFYDTKVEATDKTAAERSLRGVGFAIRATGNF